MPGNAPVPVGTTSIRTVRDQTSALIPMPTPPPNRGPGAVHYIAGEGVSFELQDAPSVCIVTSLSEVSPDEERVIAWLRQHKTEIIAAEAEFSVDRRSIAAAIAWEALKNVHSFSARAVGPGKPHLWRWSPHLGVPILLNLLSTTDEGTWVKAVEDRKLARMPLAPQKPHERSKLLQTASGSIRYIAASMDLIATMYERQGCPGVCAPSIRLNVPILLNEYQGSDPVKWAARVKAIKTGEVLKPGNKMALWYQVSRNQQLVEDGVGPTELPDTPVLDPADACTGDYRDVNRAEAASILQKAILYKGTPYKYGGDNKDGIDCSHLVWRAINDALPAAKFDYIDTAGMPNSPGLRKLDANEVRMSGDVILFAHHVGFCDVTPPADQAGRTVFSAEGSQTKSTPGVAWGKQEWFTGPITYYRVRVPCK